ncbi:SWIM zinc finger family protein [Myxococcota bacterium]
MIFEAKYKGASAVVHGLKNSQLAFATNTLREATFFEGRLRSPLQLREGLAALYDVVVSDFKYHPRERLEFQKWLEEQDQRFLARLGMKSQETLEQLEELEARLAELDKLRQVRRKPFHKARRAFFEHIYTDQYEIDYLLDPVITVHPDEVSFEAFSRDESSYARLAASYNLFEKVDSFECGTTNIDFSARLHDEFDRMRSYRQTHFEISPSGFSVARGEAGAHKEKKIDLPDSWVMGFLQVHSVMAMGLTHLSLAPIDMYNIVRHLRRRRTRKSPRALRWELEPGRRARVVLEPWEHVIELSECAVYEGPKAQSVRTWGRDRLHTLARMLPVCERVEVYLAGFGLPTIYVLDLGDLAFTLALSGWTDNDWTGDDKFSLLSRRLEAGTGELQKVYDALRSERRGSDAQLATATGLGVEKARSALSYLCQVGRAMFDLRSGLFRHRDLFFEPFSATKAVAMAEKAAEESNPNAKAARRIFETGNARLIARRPVKSGWKLSGSVKGTDGKRVRPLVHVDHEGHVIGATCTCSFYKSNKLTKGPCEHILALRLVHMARLEQEEK